MRHNPRDTSQKWGIPLSDLLPEAGMELSYVPEEHAYHPDKTFTLREKFLPYADIIENQYGSSKWVPSAPLVIDQGEARLRQLSRNLDLDPFFSEFSFDELLKYVINDFIQSEVSEAIQRTSQHAHGFQSVPPEPIEFAFKLMNGMRHYGSWPTHWNYFVAAYYAIPQFDFGPGFEVRFDHTRYTNSWGRAQHVEDQLLKLTKKMPWGEAGEYIADNQLFLDGIFGYLIHHQGKHALTIGFSVGAGKIFINQIQLREPQGNRWLFRLPTDILNFAVEKMYEHFDKWGFEIYLVDGKSLANKIGIHYADQPLPDEVKARIARFYSRPLRSFQKTTQEQRQQLSFHRLAPI